MSDEQRMRDAAEALRGHATDMRTEIDDVVSDHSRGDVGWEGPAADDFYEARGDIKSRVHTLADDLDEFATALETEADDAGDEGEGG